MNNTESRREFIIDILYYVVIIGIVVFLLKYVLSWCMPFVVGFLIAYGMQGIMKSLDKKLRGHNKILTLVILTLFYLIVGGLIALAMTQLISVIGSFFKNLPMYYIVVIEPAMNSIFAWVEGLLGGLSPDLLETIEVMNVSFIELLQSAIPTISSASLSYLTHFVAAVPSFLVASLLMIISSYFFAIDFDHILNFIMVQFSDKNQKIIIQAKNHTLNTLKSFIKSYGIIMAVTFVELSIGLLILRVDNAVSIALFIAIFDILPVLGTGGVMIPWIIISFVNGTFELAIGLLVVYLVITVIRNIIEPKIVAGQVGAHPVVMLISMFLGVKLLGIFGMFLLPILIILIKNLNDEEVIHLYKKAL